MNRRIGTRSIVLLLAVAIAFAAAPGIAAAETRTGGTVVIENGETVDGLTAFGGTVLVRGTVNGDLTAVGGNVIVEGTVTGNVEATAGTVRIGGDVGGDVTATGGNVYVARGATIDGSIEAAAGTIVVAGTVTGDARLAGGSITLESSAAIDGDVEYAVGDDGEFVNRGTVTGNVVERDDLSVGGPLPIPDVANWAVGVYGFIVNLVLGAVLLLVFPGTSRRIADRVAHQPVRTGGIGLLALVGTPIALVLLLLTIVGIPLSMVGFLLYGLSIWVGLVFGRFAVGAYLLDRAGWQNRWAALLVGMIAFAILTRIPGVGWVFDLAALLLGLGALAGIAYRTLGNRRGSDPDTGDSAPADVAEPAP